MRHLSPTEFSVGWICALPKELTAARVMLDEEYDGSPDTPAQDTNSYVLGRLHGHNVVMACLPAGRYGTTSAATVASNMLRTFPGIRIGLMVGIGAGVPNLDKGNDIRLGDVVVSHSDGTHPGVVQYDLGKNLGEETFELKGYLHGPPTFLLTALANLQSQHIVHGNNLSTTLAQVMNRVPQLASHGYAHSGPDGDVLHCPNVRQHNWNASCNVCQKGIMHRKPRLDTNPVVHFGTIASGNELIKNAIERDRIGRKLDAKCIEMEAAGLMNDFPCLVVRGICDYADMYKNDVWQEYAAITAAAFTRNLLQVVKPIEVTNARPAIKPTEPSATFRLGMNLFDAPDIDRDLFIGRESELRLMDDVVQVQLQNSGSSRNVLVLGGNGGMGKTQLSLAFAHHHRDEYDSVFWLNATSEATLQASLRRMAECIFDDVESFGTDNEKVLVRIKRWLSVMDNKRWLLIFDNYDEPHAYAIHDFYPHASHGTIIITTRQPRLVNGREILVQPLHELHQGLKILETRSRRTNLSNNPGAQRLVERLAGLPLALATAGSYLRHSTLTFQQYLEAYEHQWQSSAHAPVQLNEYQNRTLCTTWDLSYRSLEQRNKDAAQLLKLLAYFDHQQLWYELFVAGVQTSAPEWLSSITSSTFRFDSAMQVLAQYCLVEVQPSTHTYNIHPCVHDWIVASMNMEVDGQSYWYAFDCVANLVKGRDRTILGNVEFTRIVPHATRLASNEFGNMGGDALTNRVDRLDDILKLLKEQVHLVPAEILCLRALDVCEKALGRDHISTLLVVHNIGDLHIKKDDPVQAELMFRRALAGREKALGEDHSTTLDTVHNLGLVYTDQGKLHEAETMYVRALAGTEKALGPDHTSTLITMSGLSDLYIKQNKLSDADNLYRRVLAGCEKTLGPDHTLTLDTVHNLGELCIKQENRLEAEQLLLRALAGREKVFGSDHKWTLDTVHDLSDLYAKQNKFVEAEQMYQRTLAGYIKSYGEDHKITLSAIHDIAFTYSDQRKFDQAEEMFMRALTGYTRLHGLEHKTTIGVLFNLGYLYTDSDKLLQAEQMYQRALSGYSKLNGPHHSTVMNTAYNLGLVHVDQRKHLEAEQMFQQVINGRAKVLGLNHDKTLAAINKLSDFYEDRGKISKAHQLNRVGQHVRLDQEAEAKVILDNVLATTLSEEEPTDVNRMVICID